MLDVTEIFQKLSEKLVRGIEDLVVLLPNLVGAGILVALARYLARGTQRVVIRVVMRVTGNVHISQILGTAARVALVLLGFFAALTLLKLDKTVTSLLAGVGVVGLALGFAFQDIAANFMAGFIMALNRPFEVGDLVEVGGQRGRIRHIAFRASELETLDGLSVLIPNKEIFQRAIINYTQTPERRVDVTLGTAYGDDMETVRRVVLGALDDVPFRDPSREAELFFKAFGDSSIQFDLRLWLNRSDEQSYLHARSEALIRVKRALDTAGLTIPFPIRTLDFGAGRVGGTRLDAMQLRVLPGEGRVAKG